MDHCTDHELALVCYCTLILLLYLVHIQTRPFGAKEMETDQPRFGVGYPAHATHDTRTVLVGVSLFELQPALWIDRYSADHYGADLYQLVDLADRVRVECEHLFIALAGKRKTRYGAR